MPVHDTRLHLLPDSPRTPRELVSPTRRVGIRRRRELQFREGGNPMKAIRRPTSVHPGGMSEISPTFQGWEQRHGFYSPEGAADFGFSRQQPTSQQPDRTAPVSTAATPSRPAARSQPMMIGLQAARIQRPLRPMILSNPSPSMHATLLPPGRRRSFGKYVSMQSKDTSDFSKLSND